MSIHQLAAALGELQQAIARGVPRGTCAALLQVIFGALVIELCAGNRRFRSSTVAVTLASMVLLATVLSVLRVSDDSAVH